MGNASPDEPTFVSEVRRPPAVGGCHPTAKEQGNAKEPFTLGASRDDRAGRISSVHLEAKSKKELFLQTYTRSTMA